MNCKRMETRWIEYLDGRLRENERRDVESHLHGCAVCRMRLEEFRAVSGLLDELPVEEPSAAFDIRVRSRLAAEPQPRGWWAWLSPSPRVAFAASLLLMLVVWNGSRPTDPDAYDHRMTASTDTEFRMIKDLPVLEDYDVLSNFEPLSDLGQETPVADRQNM